MRQRVRIIPNFRALTLPYLCTRRSEVGWRERDYARFTKKEWSSYLGGDDLARPSNRRGGSGGGGSFWNQRVGWPLFLAAMVSGITFLAWGHIESLLGLRVPTAVSHFTPPATTPPPNVSPRQPSNLIRIRWRTQDLAPAAAAGRLCVTDTLHGRICANYVGGERPADTLTRRLQSLGLSVESSG